MRDALAIALGAVVAAVALLPAAVDATARASRAEALLERIDPPAQDVPRYVRDPVTVAAPNPLHAESRGTRYRGGVPDGWGGGLAVGGSSTYGWGVEASEAWPARLGAVNGGIEAVASPHLVGRLLRDGLALRPSVVVLYVGCNDAALRWGGGLALPEYTGPLGRGSLRRWAQGSPLTFARSLRTLIGTARLDGARVVVVRQAVCHDCDAVSVPAWAIDEYGRVVEVVAQAEGATLVVAELPRALMFDSIHPTPEGHAQLAEQIREAL